MDAIVDIQIARLQKLLADRKIALNLDDKARSWLGDNGYDPVYGARPLRRVIQKKLQDPLAELLLSGEIGDGDTLDISADADGLTINGKPAGGRDAFSIGESRHSPPPGALLN